MIDAQSLKKIQERKTQWEQTTLKKTLEVMPERQAKFVSISNRPVKVLYTPLDIAEMDYNEDIGFPGEYPFTRGIHATMHRGRLWTMRQFAGFGTAEDTNRRFHYLLSQGQTGLSVAFDLPTLMGYDSDHPMSRGEVGREGVAIDTLEDMEILFKGIPLDQISTSMTINGPAIVLLAMYLAVAEKQGISPTQLRGTLQADILKEYIAQREWICPPEPAMRILTDIVVYCTRHMPQWNSISISGYHIREAGSTAVQELAFTLYDGLTYVDYGIQAGLEVDEFAPRLSFFFNAHNDFFEEIAKYRAARRIWAREMKRRYNPKNPRSLMLRFHTQTAGCSATAQQPLNNIIRTTIQALAAVLGGTQSLHTNSYDETLALPTEEAVTIALRTQQIIAYESEVTNTVDPLGGSYYLEKLTNEMEEAVYDYFKKLDALGGMIPAIHQGFPQKEIQEAAYTYQKQIENKEKIIVGVNEFVATEETPLEILKISPEVEKKQLERLESVKKRRDPIKHKAALEQLRTAAKGKENLVPPALEAVKAYATIGEICDVFREVFGIYQDPGFF